MRETCDCCGVTAYVGTWHPILHKRMTWCAHHWHANEQGAKAEGWIIEWDRRSELTSA
jgi:hypothetical protein